MSKRAGLFVGGFVVLVVGGGVLFAIWFKWHFERETAYLIYVNAMVHYTDSYGRMPKSIDDLEAAWNSVHTGGASLPLSGHSRPIFRPLRSWEGGPYLMFIEREPPWYSLRTMAIYCVGDEDGLKAMPSKFVRRSKLDELIAEDDARRAAAGELN